MSGEPERPLRVTAADLYEERVDAWLQREEALHAVPEPVKAAPPGPFAFLLNGIAYNSIAGLLGGLLAWGLLEPLYDDDGQGALQVATGLLFFPVVGMCIGGLLGAMEGIVTRNPGRAFRGGVTAMGISFGLCLLGGFVADIVFSIGQFIVFQAFGSDGTEGIRGPAFFGFMVARGVAWAVAGLGVGVAQGLAMKSRKVLANGLVGGLVGGLLGGLCFDPLDRLIVGEGWATDERTVGADLSRGLGVTMVGLLVGFFIGLVESIAKDAWLHMRAGPLRGKQFILYNDPTTIGSSPKCHVYIFKDPAVEPVHATLSLAGTRHRLKDNGSGAGTTVNGRPVKTHVLSPGDRIGIGDTVLEYQQRIRG